MIAVVLCGNDFAGHLRTHGLYSGVQYLSIAYALEFQPNKIGFHSGFGLGYFGKSHVVFSVIPVPKDLRSPECRLHVA